MKKEWNWHDRLYIITDNRTPGRKVHWIRGKTRNECLSIDAFCHQKKVYPKFCKHFYVDWQIGESAMLDIVGEQRYNVIRSQYIETYHTSVWDFYKSIGWDYKRKDWVLIVKEDINMGKVNERYCVRTQADGRWRVWNRKMMKWWGLPTVSQDIAKQNAAMLNSKKK